MKRIFCLLLFLPFAGGCLLPGSPEITAESQTEQEALSGELKQLQLAARKNFLEIQAADSLQLLAGEYVGNQLLLRIPDAAAGVRGGRKAVSPELDLQLPLLEASVSYCYLLTQERNAELLELRLPRSAELLDRTVALLWSKLAAVSEEIGLLGETPERRRLAEEYQMELRVYTGLRAEEIARCRFDTLPYPQPQIGELSDLQKRAVRQRSESKGALYSPELSRKCKEFFRYDRATPLLIAEGLLRLPRRIEEYRIAHPHFDGIQAARLGAALGVAAGIELDFDYLGRAYENWRIAKLKLELTPQDKDAQLAEISARLDWRIAYFCFLADLGSGDRMPPATGSAADSELETELLKLLGAK